MPGPSILVGTWNVLAESYFQQRPEEYDFRQCQIAQVLQRCRVDVLLLQEVDHFEDFFAPTLERNGYDCEYYQRPQRKDGLVIAVKRDAFIQLRSKRVSYDRLANGDRLDDSSFMRHNIGLICEYRCDQLDCNVVIANTHLYWNPQKPEIKMAQMQEFCDEIKLFTSNDECLPVVLGGDFNARPEGQLYKHLTQGLSMSPAISQYGPDTRFLCDMSLLKVCKWLRLLGVDASMETQESHLARTKKPKKKAPQAVVEKYKLYGPQHTPLAKDELPKAQDYSLLFNTARTENRVLLTSSRSVRERAACPPSHLVGTNNFEAALVGIVTKFGLDIREEKFLTVCGKCGGKIATLEEVSARVNKEKEKKDEELKSEASTSLDARISTNMESSETSSIAICHYFQLANCREGDNCKYRHVIGDDALTGAASPPTIMSRADISFEDGQKAQVEAAKGNGVNIAEKGKIGSDLTFIPPNKPIFACTRCLQIYWWNDRSDSSPARAMRVAMKLLDMIKLSRDTPVQSGSANIPSSIYASGVTDGEKGDEEKEKHLDKLNTLFQSRDTTLLKSDEKVDNVIDNVSSQGQATNEKAETSEVQYLSAYAAVHELDGSGHAITNWNQNFQETLDYIFVRKNGPLKPVQASVIPRLVESDSEAGYYADGEGDWRIIGRSQPSADWPSDHFLVSAKLELSKRK